MIHIKKVFSNILKKISEEHLIIIDYKVVIFFLSLFVIFSFLVLFKVHGSSISMWNNKIPDEYNRETILLGSPKAIRSDEWAVKTPFILSQAFCGFPVENENLGKGKVPLVLDLPVYHYIILFRPKYWGFFIFDIERAFSFYWNYKSFLLFMSFFFLLMLLTENNFYLSVAASLWLYLSGFIQWWFSVSMPEMIISFNIIFIACVYLFFSRKPFLILFSSLLLVIFSLNFILNIYPPFQVPFFYLLLFLFVGYFVKNYHRFSLNENLLLRSMCLFFIFIISVVILCCFFMEIKDTVEIMAGTVYPGNRISCGGEISINKYFSGFYDVFYEEDYFPFKWINVCEASNFILLYPVVLVIILRNLLLRRKNYFVLEIFLLIYILLLTLWILVGFPSVLGKLSLLSRVPSNRALLGLGIANIILVVTFLSNNNVSCKYKISEKIVFWGLLIFSFIFHGISLQREDVFFQLWHTVIVAFSFFIVTYFFISKKSLYFFLFLSIFLLPNFLINPVSIGLSPVLNKKLVEEVRRIAGKEPEAKWAVWGDFMIPELLKASGINVFNGMKYTPDLEKMEIVDPEKKYIDIYNRFACIEFQPQKDRGSDITFKLIYFDHYAMAIKPSSHKVEELDIKYILLTDTPDKTDFLHLYPLVYIPDNNIWICEYNSLNNTSEAYIKFKSMESGKSAEIVSTPLISSVELRDDVTDFSIDVLNDVVVCGEKEPLFLSFEEDMVFVRGWAADRLAGDISGRVYIDIDGKVYSAYYGLERPDVAEAYNRLSYKYSGFEALISALQAGKGRHCLSIKILSKDGTYFYSPEKKIFFEFR